MSQKELQEAMQGTDYMALEKALDQATKVGVEQELIDAGWQRCENMLCDMFLAALDKVGVISEIPYGPFPIPRFGDNVGRKLSCDHLHKFQEVWLGIDGTFTVQGRCGRTLWGILRRLKQPLGIADCEPPLTDAQLRQHLGELDVPDHDGQIQFLETLSALRMKTMGQGESFLMIAVREGGDQGLRVAKALLDAKADIEERSKEGSTALYAACQCSNAEMVRLLLEHGASKDLALSHANRVLHDAEEVVAFLRS